MLTKPLPGVMDDPFHPLSQGCVCHLLFNEGTGSLAYDVSGHGNHGALKNMLPNSQNSGWGGSKFGGGLEFDGSNDFMECTHRSSIDFADEDFSIVFWVKANEGDLGGGDRLFVKGTGSGGCGLGKRYEVYYIASKIYYVIDGDAAGGGKTQKVLTAAPYFDGSWHQIVFIRDAVKNEMRTYRDGNQDGTPLTNVSTTDISNTCPLYIMAGTGAESGFFPGSLDKIQIYNRTVSAYEIKQLYHDPFCNLIQVPAWQRYIPAAAALVRSYGYIF